MLRACRVCGDEGQADVGCGHAGELDLCLLGSFLEPLHSHLVAPEVNALLRLEAVSHPVDYSLVEVVAAEAVVTCGREDFLNAVAHLDDGDIEGAAAEVIDHDLLIGLFINAVCESRCGGLVDYSLDIKAGDLACVLGSLSLGIGEVSGDGDNSLGNLLAEICLCVGLQLLEDHCGDLLRGVLLVVDGDFIVGAHLSLY